MTATMAEKMDKNVVVAVYEDHAGGEAAVEELQKAGFDMKTLSVLSRGYHTEEQVVGYYSLGVHTRSADIGSCDDFCAICKIPNGFAWKNWLPFPRQ